jgi:hypothetical protein
MSIRIGLAGNRNNQNLLAAAGGTTNMMKERKKSKNDFQEEARSNTLDQGISALVSKCVPYGVLWALSKVRHSKSFPEYGLYIRALVTSVNSFERFSNSNIME